MLQQLLTFVCSEKVFHVSCARGCLAKFYGAGTLEWDIPGNRQLQACPPWAILFIELPWASFFFWLGKMTGFFGPEKFRLGSENDLKSSNSMVKMDLKNSSWAGKPWFYHEKRVNNFLDLKSSDWDLKMDLKSSD